MEILTREPQGVRRSEGSIWKALGKLYSMLIYIVIHYLIKINILEVFFRVKVMGQIDNDDCLSSDGQNDKGLTHTSFIIRSSKLQISEKVIHLNYVSSNLLLCLT